MFWFMDVLDQNLWGNLTWSQMWFGAVGISFLFGFLLSRMWSSDRFNPITYWKVFGSTLGVLLFAWTTPTIVAPVLELWS